MDVGGCLHNNNNAGAVMEKLTQPLQKLKKMCYLDDRPTLLGWRRKTSHSTDVSHRRLTQTVNPTKSINVYQQHNRVYNHDKQFLCFIIQMET